MASSPRTSMLLRLSFLLILASSYNPKEISHYTNFVYEKCPNTTQHNREFLVPPQNMLSSLLQELTKKSLKSKFYQTNTGDDTVAIFGLFQCRGDLTNENCHNCILNAVSEISCGLTLPSRVQLNGCYLSLEPEPEPEPEPDPERERIKRMLISTSPVQKDYLQHKKCGEAKVWFSGFEETRDAAFQMVATCVMSSGDGYCETRHDGIYVVGQCEGSLGECECGECVSNAFRLAQDECPESDSGEIYLENCFISYSYDESNRGQGDSYKGNGIGNGSAKLVAIVVGGGVALGLIFAFCYCIRSSRKKLEDG